MSKGDFSVDILALLSIVTSLILGQYWVAAIVVLMLSGGQALESYATGRASSVLSALAKRMPQTAHRAGEVVSDVSIDSIVVDDELIIYPHEICPVDGVVVSGQGRMDESYLTGEPFLIAKAPGSSVLSGSINGDAALTIRATKVASDSRYAKIVEVLHASEENRPRMQRLGDRLGSWYGQDRDSNIRKAESDGGSMFWGDQARDSAPVCCQLGAVLEASVGKRGVDRG